MSRISACVLVMFAMLFGVNSASAVNAEKPLQSRALQGVLSGDNGEQLKFSIPEGQALTIRGREDGTTYRLVAKRLGRNSAVLEVVDPASGGVLDRFELGLNEKAQHGALVPFSVSFTGMVEKTMACRTPKAAGGAKDGETTESTCCITCGDWIVCCTPSPGWCCELECISESVNAAGDTCSACTSVE